MSPNTDSPTPATKATSPDSRRGGGARDYDNTRLHIIDSPDVFSDTTEHYNGPAQRAASAKDLRLDDVFGEDGQYRSYITIRGEYLLWSIAMTIIVVNLLSVAIYIPHICDKTCSPLLGTMDAFN